MIFILDSSGERTTPYSAYRELWTENTINETESAGFIIPAEDTETFKHEDIIEIPFTGDFVIKEKTTIEDGFIEVIAKRHLPCLDEWVESKGWQTMTAKAMLTDLLQGTYMELVMPDYPTRRTVRGQHTSKKALLFQIVDTFGLEVIIKRHEVYVARVLGEDKGTYATDELNLVDLQSSSDTYDFATRIEPRGKDGMTIATINNGRTYLENHSYSDKVITAYWEDNRYTVKENLMEDAARKLAIMSQPLITYGAQIIDLAKGDESSMWHFNEGDVITLLSSKTNERLKQRVVSIKKYPHDPYKNEAILANRPRTTTDVEDLKVSQEILGEEIKDGVKQDTYNLDQQNIQDSLYFMNEDIEDLNEKLIPGGLPGQVLTKTSEDDWDVEWGKAIDEEEVEGIIEDFLGDFDLDVDLENYYTKEETDTKIGEIDFELIPGGLEGQILMKASDADYDYVWVDFGGVGRPLLDIGPIDFSQLGDVLVTTQDFEGRNYAAANNWRNGAFFTSDGTYTPSDTRVGTVDPILINGKVRLDVEASNLQYSYFFYDSNMNFITGEAWFGFGTTVTAPANATFLNIGIGKTNNSNIAPSELKGIGLRVTKGDTKEPYSIPVEEFVKAKALPLESSLVTGAYMLSIFSDNPNDTFAVWGNTDTFLGFVTPGEPLMFTGNGENSLAVKSLLGSTVQRLIVE